MNRMIKRLFCLALALTFCGGLVQTVSAEEAPAASAVSQDVWDAMEVLRLLGIIPEDYYDYNVNVSELVTRADFAAAAARLINADTARDTGLYYYDVPPIHWAYDEINALTEMGILSGHGEKLFRPDDPIEKNEAYKMLLTMMGYGDLAEYNGGYPSGYLAMARKTEINDGLSDDTLVSRGDMFLLLFNAMTAPVLEPVAFGEDKGSYQESETDTLLRIYRDVVYDRGQVRGVDGMTLDGGVLNPGWVRIGETDYQSDVSLTEYLGQEVRFLYLDQGRNREGRVLWAGSAGVSDVLEIQVDGDASFDRTSYVLTYMAENGQRARSVRLSRNMVLVYNGGVVDTEIDQILNLPKYSLRLVGRGGEYSVAIVMAYENLVIAEIDSMNLAVYDKVTSGKKLDLNPENYDDLKLRMSGLTDIGFNELAVGQVLTSYTSKDGRRLEVAVSTEQISGVINSIVKDREGYDLVINAVEYYLPPTAQNVSLNPGDSVTLYLDVFGQGAYVEVMNGRESYLPAFLFRGELRQNGFDGTMMFKALKGDGSVEILECADRVEVDGETYKKGSEVRDLFYDGDQFKPQLVMLELNSEGQICMLDTVYRNPKREGENTLAVSVPYQTGITYRSTTGILGKLSVFDNNTIIFSVPADDAIAQAEDESFMVIKRNDIGDYASLSAETYKTRDKIGYEQFVLLKGYQLEYKLSEMPVLVENVGTSVNQEGEIVETVDGYQAGNPVTIQAGKDVSFKAQNVAPGMLLRVLRDTSGNVTSYEVMFDYAKREEFNNDTGYSSMFRLAAGYVTEVVDQVVKIAYDTPGQIDQVNAAAGIPVLIYETDSGRNSHISVGNINDARAYCNVGDDCSFIVILTRAMEPSMFVIYE